MVCPRRSTCSLKIGLLAVALCCSLNSARAEYRLQGVRELADPRERLRRYLSPELLASWEPAHDRWLSAGLRLKPDYGTTATLEIEGLEGDPLPRAVTRFTDRSVIERGRERQYNNREWVLTAWLRPDLSRIENATFRPAAAAGGPP